MNKVLVRLRGTHPRYQLLGLCQAGQDRYVKMHYAMQRPGSVHQFTDTVSAELLVNTTKAGEFTLKPEGTAGLYTDALRSTDAYITPQGLVWVLPVQPREQRPALLTLKSVRPETIKK